MSGTCDFELDFCGWMQDAKNDQFDWSRDIGENVDHGTAPKLNDVTTGTTQGKERIFFSCERCFQKQFVITVRLYCTGG